MISLRRFRELTGEKSLGLKKVWFAATGVCLIPVSCLFIANADFSCRVFCVRNSSLDLHWLFRKCFNLASSTQILLLRLSLAKSIRSSLLFLVVNVVCNSGSFFNVTCCIVSLRLDMLFVSVILEKRRVSGRACDP